MQIFPVIKTLLQRQFFRYFTFRFLAMIVASLASIASSILTARLLGAEGKGIYVLVYATMSMSVAFTGLKLGFSQVYLRQQSSFRELASTSTFVSVIAGIFPMLACTAAVYLLQDTVYKGIPIHYMLFSVFFAPVLLFTMNLRGALNSNYDVYRATVVGISQALLFLLLFSITTLLSYANIESALVCMAISIFGSSALALFMLHQKRALSVKSIDPELSKSMVIFSLKTHMGSLFIRMQERLDVFLVAFFMAPADVGIYSVALSVSEISERFSLVANSMLLSKLSQTGQDKKSIRITAKLNRVILLFTLLAVVFLAILSDWIVRIAFGDQFMDAASAIRYLLPGIVASSIFRIMNTNLVIRGKPASFSLVVSLGVAVMLIGDVILIPLYGINGAAIACSLSYTLTATIICIMVISNHDLKIREYFICLPELRALWKHATKRAD